MSGPPRVALLVTHLMGAGHLVRTLALARALAAAGARPLVLSGGRPLPHLDASGVELAQLPPLASDGVNYRRLLRPDGAPATEADLAARRAALAEALQRFAPRALVTELYPFGRRILAAEFEDALAALPPGAPAFASIRDILEPPSGPDRVAETVSRLAPYRAVLVHGDPQVASLEASWPGDGAPLPAPVARRLRFTGYVAEPSPAPTPGPGEGEVLVATGGGVIGRRLLETAARASALSPLRWRLRVGGADAAQAAARLSALGPAVAEPAAADYRARLARAAVSVSLAGYNTAVEVALSGTPALFVPMEEGGEREQLLRARAFARFDEIETARIGELTPEALAVRVEALARRPRHAPPLRADGAAEAARLILAEL
ncbi:MAG: glycosyltransferase family protein [Pseudomonadota bacterium]